MRATVPAWRRIGWFSAGCARGCASKDRVCSRGSWYYAHTGSGWVLFAPLFLLPDLSLLAYLGGPKVGAVGYNVAHSYVLPIALGLASSLSGNPTLLLIALIWVSHIGFDRALGYGSKYPTGFGDTHLGPIGPTRVVATTA